MLKYVKGDLLSVKYGVVGHCVNCKGAFGGGVAGHIAKVYPDVRKFYLRKYEETGWKLGDTQFILLLPTGVPEEENTGDFIIANIAGQDDFGTHKVQVDYDALKIGLDKVFNFANELDLPVALPKLGCGLAGGEWEKVENIITGLLMEYPIEVTIYEL